MLASEEKLAANNMDLLLTVCKGIALIRENGGFGDVVVKVQNGKAVVCRPTVEWHLEGKKAT
jgi:hypothetical protein